jgi:multiple sugar transport system permease protein
MATIARGREQAVAVGGASPKRRFSLAPYLFILPHLIFFAVFVGFPFFFGLGISVFQYDYLRPERTTFVGLDNYLQLFQPGSVEFPLFWNALINTVIFVIISVPPLVVIPLLLAVLLNTKTPGRNIFRGVYFAPWVLSVTVVSLIWWWIFQSNGGLVNYYLGSLGLFTPRWLSTLPWGWIAILVATIWWTMGFNMVILLAALQDIPESLYEAASIDGASALQAFFKITVPLLQPVLAFIITISIIASFNLFGQPFLMTHGAPPNPGGGGGTEPIMYRIYIEGFQRSFQGIGAAMSFVVAAIMIVVSLINFRLFNSGSQDQ